MSQQRGACEYLHKIRPARPDHSQRRPLSPPPISQQDSPAPLLAAGSSPGRDSNSLALALIGRLRQRADAVLIETAS